MIFIAPWSYKVNGVLRQYFSRFLTMFPAPPKPKLTVLVLEANKAFEFLYVSFPTNRALSLLSDAISIIQIYGVVGFNFAPIKDGLPMRFCTVPTPNSSVGYFMEDLV